MDFSDALIYLKAGKELTRRHWEDKILYRGKGENGMRIFFTSAKGSEGFWIPHQADLLAEDWELGASAKTKVTTEAQNDVC